MTYSIVSIVALIISVIVNVDILFLRKEKTPYVIKIYILFLISLFVYFISDALWGILYDYKLVTALIIDTSIYFLSMAATVLLWMRYISLYLKQKKSTAIAFAVVGWMVFVFAVAIIIINLFHPILFEFTETKEYHSLTFRYAYLTMQLAVFVLMSIYAFVMSFRAEREVRNRFLAISIFGFVMAVAILTQTLFPLLPLYAVGCMIGVCIIHVFVSGSEKEENRQKLEAAFLSEKQQKEELERAKALLYEDSLTGAKSRHAYVKKEIEIDKLISDGAIQEFAIIMFDINGLKNVNDSKGHKFGDDYIKICFNEICKVYKNIPIYRFGGDEFVIILEGEVYKNKDILINEFENRIENNVANGFVSISSGMATFNPNEDNTMRAVFIKADSNMYRRKKDLKDKSMDR